MDNLQWIFRNIIVDYFKTGNMLIDFLVTFFVISIAQYIINSKFDIKKIFSFCKCKKRIKSEYIIEGKIKNTNTSKYIESEQLYFPKEYRAIMYKLSVLNINIKSVKQYDKRNMSTQKHYSFVLNDTENIKITDNIYIIQENNSHKSNDIKIELETYTMRLYSYTLTFNELHSELYKWVCEYDEYLWKSKDDKIYYYSYVGSHNLSSNIIELVFERSEFSTNKTFDNIFFDDKNKLKERLSYFIDRPDEYKRLGIPHTLGLLFYGEPGNGKTSASKAIANYTKRNIINIPLSKVKTCKELNKIFMDTYLIDRYVPINKRIYLFEDIDCMSDVIIDRDINKDESKNLEDQKDSKDQKVILYVNDKKPTDVLESNNSDNDRLTLSFILNLIDGVLEQPGRIIIMTTNKPSKIDKALLRPGRIDLKIKFGKCSKAVCRDIICFFFKNEIKSMGDIENFDFPDDKYTVAELIEICFNNIKLEKVLDIIKR